MEHDDNESRAYNEWYDEKSRQMERMLGKEHNMVMHAIIPFDIGGSLDLYYYPYGIKGTAIATKELVPLPGEGPSNDRFETYELVMFTRQKLVMDDAKKPRTAFGKVHQSINLILNNVARYAPQATLNPNETLEFPRDMQDVGGKCIFFDEYGSDNPYKTAEFGLLALIEIFRSEMEFAMREGGGVLLDKLKAAGHYPYSDMDRRPVA